MESGYDLVYYGSDVLRRQTRPFDAVDEDVVDLAEEMARVMYENKGVGLAGPQVGVDRRIILVDVGDELHVLVNPEILAWGPENEFFEEGCLSLPEVTVMVERPTSVVVEYLDLDNQKQRQEYGGLLARVVQHEMDHLSGKLIIDYMGVADRELLKKKLRSISRKNDPKIL